MLCNEFGVSQRRACKVIGQHRPTQRLARPVPDDEEARLRGVAASVRRGPFAVGLASRLRRTTARRVAGQPQAHPAAVARRGPAGPAATLASARHARARPAIAKFLKACATVEHAGVADVAAWFETDKSCIPVPIRQIRHPCHFDNFMRKWRPLFRQVIRVDLRRHRR